MTFSATATSEEVAQALLSSLVEDAPRSHGSALHIGHESGLLADTARWTDAYPDAADTLFRGLLRASSDPLSGMIGMYLLGLGDLVTAYARAETSPDTFVEARPTRLARSPGGLVFAFLSPINDGRELLREVMGRVPQRPLHLTEAPTTPLRLDRGEDLVAFASELGVSDEDLDALWRRKPDRAVLRRVLIKIFTRMSHHDPILGAACSALVESDPDAAAATPFVRLLLAVLRGVRRPERVTRFQFVQAVDLGLLGTVAIVVWDPGAPIAWMTRARVAAHVRHLCDHRIAPWLRWRDRKRRRETWYLYIRHAVNGRPQVQRCAQVLRERHAEDYEGEPLERTIRRLYRLSDYVREAEISPLLRGQAREAVAVR